MTLLSVKDLTVRFRTEDGPVLAVDEAVSRTTGGGAFGLTADGFVPKPFARLLAEQSNTDVIAEALHAVLGVRWRVRCEHGDAPVPPPPARGAAEPRSAANPPPPGGFDFGRPGWPVSLFPSPSKRGDGAPGGARAVRRPCTAG